MAGLVELCVVTVVSELFLSKGSECYLPPFRDSVAHAHANLHIYLHHSAETWQVI